MISYGDSVEARFQGREIEGTVVQVRPDFALALGKTIITIRIVEYIDVYEEDVKKSEREHPLGVGPYRHSNDLNFLTYLDIADKPFVEVANMRFPGLVEIANYESPFYEAGATIAIRALIKGNLSDWWKIYQKVKEIAQSEEAKIR